MGEGWFHNPYNFVPAPPRSSDGSLADAGPTLHDRFDRGWTGRIRVTMTVQTPLLLPDAAKASTSADGHVSMPMRTVKREEGEPPAPYVAGSSFKGMLRAAYEAVTDSRLGLAPSIDHRYAYRQRADNALGLLPARVTDDNSHLELLLGTACVNEDGTTERNRCTAEGRPYPPAGETEPTQFAAWWPAYDRRGRGIAPLPLPEVNSAELPDGSELKVKLQLYRHTGQGPQPSFRMWEVVGYTLDDRVWVEANHDALRYDQLDGELCVWGYLHRTGQSFGRKHDERVFFRDPAVEPGDAGHLVELTEDLRRCWEDVVRGYYEAHTDAERNVRRGAPGGADWSPYVKRPGHRLEPGTPCYVRWRNGRPDGLFPVMIGREPFAVKPQVDPSVRPARRHDELSPAERVFGWVAARRERSEATEAVRGHLRVGPVRATDPRTDDRRRVLAVLSQPKPQQGRFYAGRGGDGTSYAAPLRPGAEKASWFSDGTVIRGRKVYVHHRAWAESGAQAARRSNQNCTVVGAVLPGSRFDVDLFVDNLAPAELGALLWLLGLPDGHYHRLGYAKPLGFGSVRLDVDWSNTELNEPHDVPRRWTALCPRPPARATGTELREALVKEFRTALHALVGDNDERILGAFLAAAKGFDGVPVSYPLADDDDGGEHFRWFNWNDSNQGRRLPLPELSEDMRPLPVAPVAPASSRRRGPKGGAGGRQGPKGGRPRGGRPR